MNCPNLLESIPDVTEGEIFEPLIETSHLKLERIISRGHATPPGAWYDQDMEEWVILLKGSAGLLFEGEAEIRVLRPGDCLHVPSRQRHRVEWTDAVEKTVWLALHY